jgi:hypothetical protein
MKYTLCLVLLPILVYSAAIGDNQVLEVAPASEQGKAFFTSELIAQIRKDATDKILKHRANVLIKQMQVIFYFLSKTQLYKYDI